MNFSKKNTQLEYARQGIITEEVKMVAELEGVEPELLRQFIANGHAVLLKNKIHNNKLKID